MANTPFESHPYQKNWSCRIEQTRAEKVADCINTEIENMRKNLFLLQPPLFMKKVEEVFSIANRKLQKIYIESEKSSQRLSTIKKEIAAIITFEYFSLFELPTEKILLKQSNEIYTPYGLNHKDSSKMRKYLQETNKQDEYTFLLKYLQASDAEIEEFNSFQPNQVYCYRMKIVLLIQCFIDHNTHSLTQYISHLNSIDQFDYSIDEINTYANNLFLKLSISEAEQANQGYYVLIIILIMKYGYNKGDFQRYADIPSVTKSEEMDQLQNLFAPGKLGEMYTTITSQLSSLILKDPSIWFNKIYVPLALRYDFSRKMSI